MLNSQKGLLCQLQACLSILYMVVMGSGLCKPQFSGGSCFLLDSANAGATARTWQEGKGRKNMLLPRSLV